jgi:hypothetical protein
MRKRLTPGVVLGALAVVLAMSGSAVAGSLITSAKIKDGTIQNKDIKKGTIALNRLTPAAQAAIKRAGTPGATGAPGVQGAPGPKGDPGDPGTTPQASPGKKALANWGVINRNVEGSGDAFLRQGPADPLYGDGSLNLTTGSDKDKAVFGNEIDEVAGGLLANVEQVGFHVFTTQENSKRGNNMPSIIFEINPNRGDRPERRTRRWCSCRTTRRTGGAATSTPRRPPAASGA